MEQPPSPAPKRRWSRKRILLAAGGAVLAGVVALAVFSLVVLYKATRKFPLRIVDVVPADAVAYVEADAFSQTWPAWEAFLAKARQSPRYERMLATEPVLAKAGLDRSLDEALRSLDQVQAQTGIDPLEAAAGFRTAVAVFAREDEAAAGPAKEGEPPPARITYAAFTFLKGLKVRVAALFADTVLSRAAPEDLAVEEKDGYTCLCQASDGSLLAAFAVLDDLLVVSNDPDRLEEILGLASTGIAASLGTTPAFTEAMDALPAGETADLRAWVDFPAADRFLAIRKKADLRITTFPYIYVARILNGLQRSVIDLERTEALACTVRIDPDRSALLLDGLFRYASDEVNPFLVKSYALEPAPPLAARTAPPGVALTASARKDFQEFWDQLGYQGDADSRESFYKVTEKHGPLLSNVIGALGRDFALFLKPSPAAGTRRAAGAAPPLPWICAVARSPDPDTVAQNLRAILRAEIDARAGKVRARDLPVLREETRGAARVLYLDNMPMEVQREVSPDFRPGFFRTADTVGVFSSTAMAYEVVDYMARNRTLEADPTYGRVRALLPERWSAGLYADNHALMGLLMGYRSVLAREMKPLDWDEANRVIARQHGAGLPPDRLKKYQDAYAEHIRRQRNELAARLAARLENLKMVRAVGAAALCRSDERNRAPTGLSFRLACLFDID